MREHQRAAHPPYVGGGAMSGQTIRERGGGGGVREVLGEEVGLGWGCNAGVHNLGDADCPHRYSRRGDWKVIKEILQMKGYEVPDE